MLTGAAGSLASLACGFPGPQAGGAGRGGGGELRQDEPSLCCGVKSGAPDTHRPRMMMTFCSKGCEVASWGCEGENCPEEAMLGEL